YPRASAPGCAPSELEFVTELRTRYTRRRSPWSSLIEAAHTPNRVASSGLAVVGIKFCFEDPRAALCASRRSRAERPTALWRYATLRAAALSRKFAGVRLQPRKGVKA